MVALVELSVPVVKDESNASISFLIFIPWTTKSPVMVTLLSTVVVSLPLLYVIPVVCVFKVETLEFKDETLALREVMEVSTLETAPNETVFPDGIITLLEMLVVSVPES